MPIHNIGKNDSFEAMFGVGILWCDIHNSVGQRNGEVEEGSKFLGWVLNSLIKKHKFQ